MTNKPEIGDSPFGEVSCQAEMTKWGDEYHEHFYGHKRFSREALDPRTYLIIGRRGSGKSSLAQSLTFQDKYRGAKCIIIKDPEVYAKPFEELAKQAHSTAEIAIPRIVKIWDVLIWSLIFEEFRDIDDRINEACYVKSDDGQRVRLVEKTMIGFLDTISYEWELHKSDSLDEYYLSERFKNGKDAVLKHSSNTAIIVAVETLEKYSVRNKHMMRTIAGLVEAASNIQLSYSNQGIYIKVFLAAEVFLHVRSVCISNPPKYVRDPLYLHWKPKSLLRLVCWRFYRHLQSRGMLLEISSGDIKWKEDTQEGYEDVRAKMWDPYFGKTVRNGHNLEEDSFAYVLRHTQMRPREMVILCNAIAKCSGSAFPRFSSEAIVGGIKDEESNLANEVINSFSEIYPEAHKIVEALILLPNFFNGSKLDKVASKTKTDWPDNTYSGVEFRRLVTELGIVGRVEADSHRQSPGNQKIIEAEFEYSIKGPIGLQPEEECVIHPMFYQRFRINLKDKFLVYPFIPRDSVYRFY